MTENTKKNVKATIVAISIMTSIVGCVYMLPTPKKQIEVVPVIEIASPTNQVEVVEIIALQTNSISTNAVVETCAVENTNPEQYAFEAPEYIVNKIYNYPPSTFDFTNVNRTKIIRTGPSIHYKVNAQTIGETTYFNVKWEIW